MVNTRTIYSTNLLELGCLQRINAVPVEEVVTFFTSQLVCKITLPRLISLISGKFEHLKCKHKYLYKELHKAIKSYRNKTKGSRNLILDIHTPFFSYKSMPILIPKHWTKQNKTLCTNAAVIIITTIYLFIWNLLTGWYFYTKKKNLKQSSLITMVLMRRCLDLLILLIYFLQGTVQRHQIFRFSYC